jgi:hypothetical protein
MELTNENYHSIEARSEYMGYSQFKDFLDCEKKGLARVKGELEDESSPALLFGSYVDNYFSKEIPMEEFKAKHQEMFKKDGTFKSDFKNIEPVIAAIEGDKLLSKYLGGEHQVIMTGTIAGVKFKIKIDAYHRDKAIVDQKIMKDMSSVWVEVTDEDGEKRNVRMDFIKAWRYDLEGAIYQEIERQWNVKHGGEDRKLPFILAVTTKEDVPDKALIKIDQDILDAALAEVVEKAPRFDAIKRGEIEPKGCGSCDVCRKGKMLTGVFSYKKLFHMEED